MYRTIVVPLDGSTLANRALPIARALAASGETRIVLVRAVPPPIAPAPGSRGDADPELEVAQAYLAGFARLPMEGHARVLPVARRGEPAATILVEARRYDADLIVMASHGRSGPGRAVFGSVSDEVVRRSEAPVLVVPERGRPHRGKKGQERILVTLDASERAEAALAPAIELADALGAGITLLHVVAPAEYLRVTEYPDGSSYLLGFDGEPGPDDDLADLARRLSRPGRTVRPRVESGDPASSILAVAEEEQVDAIVMASHGRRGLARLTLGSVTTEIARRSPVPVLVVRAPARLRATPGLDRKTG